MFLAKGGRPHRWRRKGRIRQDQVGAAGNEGGAAQCPARDAQLRRLFGATSGRPERAQPKLPRDPAGRGRPGCTK